MYTYSFGWEVFSCLTIKLLHCSRTLSYRWSCILTVMNIPIKCNTQNASNRAAPTLLSPCGKHSCCIPVLVSFTGFNYKSYTFLGFSLSQSREIENITYSTLLLMVHGTAQWQLHLKSKLIEVVIHQAKSQQAYLHYVINQWNGRLQSQWKDRLQLFENSHNRN